MTSWHGIPVALMWGVPIGIALWYVVVRIVLVVVR